MLHKQTSRRGILQGSKKLRNKGISLKSCEIREVPKGKVGQFWVWVNSVISTLLGCIFSMVVSKLSIFTVKIS